MKTTKNFTFVLTLIASVIFFSTSIFAQEDPVKNQEQNQVQTQDQEQIRIRLKTRNKLNHRVIRKHNLKTKTKINLKNRIKTR